MEKGVLLFRRDLIFESLSGTAEDLQRRVWLIGRENADKSFAAIFTRRRRNDLHSQPWRYHDEEEVEFIVAGRMEFEYINAAGDVQRVEAGPGDLYCIPAGVRHRADSVGEELCVGLLFCPVSYSTAEGQPFFIDDPSGSDGQALFLQGASVPKPTD